MQRAPSSLSAVSRWLPLGVRYSSPWRTTMIGSRKRLVLSIACVSLRTCASLTSRWNGVGATLSMRQRDEQQRVAAERLAYCASTRRRRRRTASASSAISGGGSASASSLASSSVGWSFTPRRLRVPGRLGCGFFLGCHVGRVRGLRLLPPLGGY